MTFSGICGLPFARLRSSIPEDILAGDAKNMVGRGKGLSAGWVKKNLTTLAVAPPVAGGPEAQQSHHSNGTKPSAAAAGGADAQAERKWSPYALWRVRDPPEPSGAHPQGTREAPPQLPPKMGREIPPKQAPDLATILNVMWGGSTAKAQPAAAGAIPSAAAAPGLTVTKGQGGVSELDCSGRPTAQKIPAFASSRGSLLLAQTQKVAPADDDGAHAANGGAHCASEDSPLGTRRSPPKLAWGACAPESSQPSLGICPAASSARGKDQVEARPLTGRGSDGAESEGAKSFVAWPEPSGPALPLSTLLGTAQRGSSVRGAGGVTESNAAPHFQSASVDTAPPEAAANGKVPPLRSNEVSTPVKASAVCDPGHSQGQDEMQQLVRQAHRAYLTSLSCHLLGACKRCMPAARKLSFSRAPAPPRIARVQMASTALVYGLMSIRNCVTPTELNEQLARSARFFDGVKDFVGRDFRRLHFMFVGLLFRCNIPMGKKWLARARLWRLILLQQEDGSFRCSPGLALALNAHLEDDDDDNDCPLSCDLEAIRATMPEISAKGAEEDPELRLTIWVRLYGTPRIRACAPAE